jgi:hypothetical protein
MSDKLPDLKNIEAPLPATAHGITVATALLLTVGCALITIGGTMAILRGTLGTPTRAAVSVITLIALLGMTYSLVQLILAVIATAGERRWFSRQISERRQGDRARKPPKG